MVYSTAVRRWGMCGGGNSCLPMAGAGSGRVVRWGRVVIGADGRIISRVIYQDFHLGMTACSSRYDQGFLTHQWLGAVCLTRGLFVHIAVPMRDADRSVNERILGFGRAMGDEVK